MALSINTNIAALQAQRFLGLSSQALTQNQERLASGLRLNSAADDAAGVAISARMTAQIRGMSQAARNANDAISMVQTAESGLKRMEDILNQMREKAVQSANETNTNADRSSLDDEYQQMLSELDRISQEQSFNGLSLLDGSLVNAQFQIGPDTDSVDTITVDMSSSMRTRDIGSRYEGALQLAKGSTAATDTAIGNTPAAVQLGQWGASQLKVGDVVIDPRTTGNGGDVTGTDAAQGKVTTSAWALAQAINNNGSLTVTAQAQSVMATAVNSTIKFTLNATATNTSAAKATYVLRINGEQVFQTMLTASNGDAVSSYMATINATQIRDQINNKAGTLGITATTSAGILNLHNTAGGNILIDEAVKAANAQATMATLSGSDAFFANDVANLIGVTSGTTGHYFEVQRGSVKVYGNSAYTFSDTAAAGDFSGLGGGTTMVTTQGPALDVTSITSRTNAQTAIEKIDRALADVDTMRGEFGAAQNRFEYTIENLEASVQNLTDARSRIVDADIAKEAADMMMNNVRRQASSAVLAQANMNPQLALQLLGG